MRVLMVSDVYFPRVNGVSTSMQTFRRALRAHGIDVDLIVPRYDGESEETGITRIPARRVPRDPEDRLMHWGALRRAVERHARRADVVHVQTPFAAHYAAHRAARGAGRPVVATYHTLFEEYLQHYAPFLPVDWLRAGARRISRGQCNELDAVVVPSAAMRDRLTRYGVVRPLHVIPTGIPLEPFAGGDGAAFRAAHGIAPDRPVALFVGRVAFEKNIELLLDAMARVRCTIPEALLLVTGDGPARETLRARVEAAGAGHAVRFLGYLDRAKTLPDCYAAADAFVFASRTETQGLVLLEAMASGCPVVALSVMGTRDILAARRGCVVPPDDVSQFADAVAALLSDAESRKRLGQEARAYAREWSDAALAGRLAALYAGIARAAHSR